MAALVAPKTGTTRPEDVRYQGFITALGLSATVGFSTCVASALSIAAAKLEGPLANSAGWLVWAGGLHGLAIMLVIAQLVLYTDAAVQSVLHSEKSDNWRLMLMRVLNGVIAWVCLGLQGAAFVLTAESLKPIAWLPATMFQYGLIGVAVWALSFWAGSFIWKDEK